MQSPLCSLSLEFCGPVLWGFTGYIYTCDLQWQFMPVYKAPCARCHCRAFSAAVLLLTSRNNPCRFHEHCFIFLTISCAQALPAAVHGPLGMQVLLKPDNTAWRASRKSAHLMKSTESVGSQRSRGECRARRFAPWTHCS